MPETNKRNPFAAEIIALQDPLRAKRKVDVEVVKNIAKKHDIEYIGQGNDSFVYAHPLNPEKVIAVDWDDFVNRDRAMYYFRNLYSMMFPHNFPRTHAAFFYPDDDKNYFYEAQYIVGTVRQRIVEGSDIIYPFGDVTRACRAYSIPLNIDPAPQNFIIGRDGGEYYVDHLSRPDTLNPEPFMQFMSDNNPEQQGKIFTWINRINTLGRG